MIDLQRPKWQLEIIWLAGQLYWYISFLKRFGWCWNVSRRKVTSRSPSWSQPCLGWGVPTSHQPLSGLQILTEKDEGEERTMRTNWHQATSKSGTMGGPLGIFTILTISLQGEVLIFFLFSLISLLFGDSGFKLSDCFFILTHWDFKSRMPSKMLVHTLHD